MRTVARGFLGLWEAHRGGALRRNWIAEADGNDLPIASRFEN